MRTIRFHEYGEPAAVLRLEAAPNPAPNAGNVAVHVHACGLNPADWALCRAGSASALPDLVEIAGGDATRIITIADFEGAAKTGVRSGSWVADFRSCCGASRKGAGGV